MSEERAFPAETAVLRSFEDVGLEYLKPAWLKERGQIIGHNDREIEGQNCAGLCSYHKKLCFTELFGCY
jgi:hypothetical protein